jgi:hypothetical protein
MWHPQVRFKSYQTRTSLARCDLNLTLGCHRFYYLAPLPVLDSIYLFFRVYRSLSIFLLFIDMFIHFFPIYKYVYPFIPIYRCLSIFPYLQICLFISPYLQICLSILSPIYRYVYPCFFSIYKYVYPFPTIYRYVYPLFSYLKIYLSISPYLLICLSIFFPIYKYVYSFSPIYRYVYPFPPIYRCVDIEWHGRNESCWPKWPENINWPIFVQFDWPDRKYTGHGPAVTSTPDISINRGKWINIFVNRGGKWINTSVNRGKWINISVNRGKWINIFVNREKYG